MPIKIAFGDGAKPISTVSLLLAVPIIFTVGIDYTAFPAGSVKGGGWMEKQYELVKVQ